MNLIYPSHAKNQVRFGEKSEKKRFGAPWRDGTGGAFPENEARAGASRREMAALQGRVQTPVRGRVSPGMRRGQGARARDGGRHKVGCKRLCEGECPRKRGEGRGARRNVSFKPGAASLEGSPSLSFRPHDPVCPDAIKKTANFIKKRVDFSGFP
jgi:hypothetical protein